MTKFGGYTGKILYVDLTEQKTEEYPWTDELRKAYPGGKFAAIKIITDLVPVNAGAIDEKNAVVIATGPLTLSGAVSSSRFELACVMPESNLLETVNCGGSFGMSLKQAGYDALVITGKAEALVSLEITDEGVTIRDATALKGMLTKETEAALDASSSKLVIGPAGERLIPAAGIFTEGRMIRSGAGAVFGSKNLKAASANGTYQVKLSYPEQFNKFNAQRRTQMLKRYEGKNLNLPLEHCITCPIRCGHLYRVEKMVLKAFEMEKMKETGLEQGLFLKQAANEYGLDFLSILPFVNQTEEVMKIASGIIKPEFKTKEKEKAYTDLDAVKDLISSLGICQFALDADKPLFKVTMEYLRLFNLATGMNLSFKRFASLGEKSRRLLMEYNLERKRRKG